MPLERTRRLEEENWLVHRNVHRKSVWWQKETQRNDQIYLQAPAESRTWKVERKGMGRPLLPHYFLFLLLSRREIIKVAKIYWVFTKGQALHKHLTRNNLIDMRWQYLWGTSNGRGQMMKQYQKASLPEIEWALESMSLCIKAHISNHQTNTSQILIQDWMPHT